VIGVWVSRCFITLRLGSEFDGLTPKIAVNVYLLFTDGVTQEAPFFKAPLAHPNSCVTLSEREGSGLIGGESHYDLRESLRSLVTMLNAGRGLS